MPIGEPDDHTAAVLTKLTGAVTLGGSAVPVADTEVTDSVSPPYIVVQTSPGGRLDGSMAKPHDDLDFVVLVKCVTARNSTDGQGRAQCQHAQGQARTLILGGVSVTGRRVHSARLDVPGGVMVDTSVEPHRFYSVDRFVIPTSPS